MRKTFFIFLLIFIPIILFSQSDVFILTDTIIINYQQSSLNNNLSKWVEYENILKIYEIKKINENKYVGSGYLKYYKFKNYTYGKVDLNFTIIKNNNTVVIIFYNFKHTSNYISFGNITCINSQPELKNNKLHPDMYKVLWIDLTEYILLQIKIINANIEYFVK
jgi:hypothetical protein